MDRRGAPPGLAVGATGQEADGHRRQRAEDEERADDTAEREAERDADQDVGAEVGQGFLEGGLGHLRPERGGLFDGDPLFALPGGDGAIEPCLSLLTSAGGAGLETSPPGADAETGEDAGEQPVPETGFAAPPGAGFGLGGVE